MASYALTGRKVKNSYNQLLIVDRAGGGNDDSLVAIADGDGDTTFALQLSTDKVKSTDLIEAGNGVAIDEFSSDGTFAGNSDLAVPTEKAIKAYITSRVGVEVADVDGDKLDIDWNPSNYTPDATISEADDADDLAAHLKGIDTEFASVLATIDDYHLMTVRAGAPGTGAGQGVIYLKDLTGVPHPFFRLESNGSEFRMLIGGADLKIWVYSNSAQQGWLVDAASATDRVLAFKGGSQAYNANGGTNAGTWTQPGHTLTEAEMPQHTHTLNNATALWRNAGGVATPVASGGSTAVATVTANNAGSSQSHNHGTTYRPAAALGTMQYPDLG